MAVVLYGLTAWNPSFFRIPLFSRSPSASAPVMAVAPEEEQPIATSSVATSSLFQYIEVVDGCGPHFDGTCVNMRSGPGENYPVVLRLRNGVLLKVKETVIRDGREWYKIWLDGGIHFPERVTGDWYVSAGEYVRAFTNKGDEELSPGEKATTTKRIIVDLSKEMLYAYDGDALFMEEKISAGLDDTPTPRGTFFVYKKTPSRYMQGPIPDVSDQYFDLPGVPWNLYFTYEGAVIHGAYWHNNFGQQWSHGCVNLSPENAQKLYEWTPVGTPVIVRD